MSTPVVSVALFLAFAMVHVQCPIDPLKAGAVPQPNFECQLAWAKAAGQIFEMNVNYDEERQEKRWKGLVRTWLRAEGFSDDDQLDEMVAYAWLWVPKKSVPALVEDSAADKSEKGTLKGAKKCPPKTPKQVMDELTAELKDTVHNP